MIHPHITDGDLIDEDVERIFEKTGELIRKVESLTGVKVQFKSKYITVFDDDSRMLVYTCYRGCTEYFPDVPKGWIKSLKDNYDD